MLMLNTDLNHDSIRQSKPLYAESQRTISDNGIDDDYGSFRYECSVNSQDVNRLYTQSFSSLSYESPIPHSKSRSPQSAI